MKALTVEEYLEGVLSGNRTMLGRGITLVESRNPAHQEQAARLLQEALPFAGQSCRIGITGVPGVGKSSFIEALGCRLCDAGHRVAVLAVDPSSALSGGSILGDKTRMEKLGRHPRSFIRPSPSLGTLGGVGSHTRETLLLCEAAGYDVILVETVGVGQSEIAVHGMVDCFLLLLLTGAGDDLQGIKKGIIEMADLFAVTKADGANLERARLAQAEMELVVRHLPPHADGWEPRVHLCSALAGTGLEALWEGILAFIQHQKKSGWFNRHRREQEERWLLWTVQEALQNLLWEQPRQIKLWRDLLPRLASRELAPRRAANLLLNAAIQCDTHASGMNKIKNKDGFKIKITNSCNYK